MAKRTIIFIFILTLILGVALPAAALTEQPYELDYSVTVPQGRAAAAGYLKDGDYRTRFTLTAGQSLSLTWEGEAGGVLLQWFDEKQWYNKGRESAATIRLYDAAGKFLSEKNYISLNYRMFLPVTGASRMDIKCKVGRAPTISLCEVKVCAPGYEPANLVKQEPVDLMLILSSVSDELDMLGGLLPLYAGEHGIKTAVVYVGRDDGNQVQEAFGALDALGLNVIPLFLQQEDHIASTVKDVSSRWKVNQIKKELAELMELYQPKVVVTCDPNDTDTLARAQFTGSLVEAVVKDKKLPVQKVYELSKTGSTVVDGSVPLAIYGGRSAVDVAREGYAQYRSEVSYRTVIPEKPHFQLIFSQVGEDQAGDDLFEHIDLGALLAYQAPTPVPTATPEPTAVPAATKAPTEEPAPSPAAEPAAAGAPAATEAPTAQPSAEPQAAAPTPAPTLVERVLALGTGALAMYAVSAVFVIAALCLIKKNRGLSLILLVLAGLLVLTVYLWGRDRKGQSAEAPTVTAAPTAASTSAPTGAPAALEETAAPTHTPAPTAAPAEPTREPEITPTPDPDDQYYRQAGEPEEVVVQDYDKGRWEYRSDILSILIDRIISYDEQNRPYCRYVAHVRMRQVNSFRAVSSRRTEEAKPIEPPWRLARSYRAVLAITGDNINNADVSLKGILIRNGILYSDRFGDSTMVMGDDMTMRIYHPKEISGLDLMDSGVTAAFSFGPILVENGQVNPDADKHHVYKENPRCGVGMVEPGHFVVIVSDGRDPRRAYGYTLGQFAQLFADEGAQIAYNLDGGQSAAMVFMGEHINWHSAQNQRTWADALVWGYSRLVPKVTDKVNHYGDGALH